MSNPAAPLAGRQPPEQTTARNGFHGAREQGGIMFHFDWWAPVARSIVAPLWAWWEGSAHLRHYRTLLQSQFDTPEIVRARQWQALTAQLRHAYDTTPFWRGRLDALGLRPEDVRSFEDFRALPVLTKHDLRTRG